MRPAKADIRISSVQSCLKDTIEFWAAAGLVLGEVPRRVAHLGDIAVAADGRRRCCARTPRESLNKGWTRHLAGIT